MLRNKTRKNAHTPRCFQHVMKGRKWKERNLIMTVCEHGWWPEATWCWIMNKKSFSFISCFRSLLAISSINSNMKEKIIIFQWKLRADVARELREKAAAEKMVFWWSFHSLNFSFCSRCAYKSYLCSRNYYIFSRAMLTSGKHVERWWKGGNESKHEHISFR